MDWLAITAIASAVVVSIPFLIWQVIALRKATYAQAFATVLEHLQNQEVRTARGAVFHLKCKPLKEWTDDEIASAERVCQSYNAVGIMVREGMLPKAILTGDWRSSLIRSWVIVWPLVEKYRTDRSAPELWGEFESQAKKAQGQRP